MYDWVYVGQDLYWWAGDAVVADCADTVISNWDNAFPELGWEMLDEAWWWGVEITTGPCEKSAVGETFFSLYVTDPYENVVYPIDAVITLNTVDYQWTDAGRRAVIAHEIGHIYGLDDKYIGTSCNNAEITVMDGATANGNTIIGNCDGLEGPGPEPESQDRPRVRAYWYQGTESDWNWFINGPNVTVTWKDPTWTEQFYGMQAFYSNGTNWVYYWGSNVEQDIGLQKTVEDRNIPLSWNVIEKGAPTGTWHCLCGYPWLAGSQRWGTWNCTSVIVP